MGRPSLRTEWVVLSQQAASSVCGRSSSRPELPMAKLFGTTAIGVCCLCQREWMMKAAACPATSLLPGLQFLPLLSLGVEKCRSCLPAYLAMQSHRQPREGGEGRWVASALSVSWLLLLLPRLFTISPQARQQKGSSGQGYGQTDRERGPSCVLVRLPTFSFIYLLSPLFPWAAFGRRVAREGEIGGRGAASPAFCVPPGTSGTLANIAAASSLTAGATNPGDWDRSAAFSGCLYVIAAYGNLPGPRHFLD